MPKAKPLTLFSGSAGGSAHTEARRALLKSWAADPWAFFTGRDTDGKPIVVTKDELSDTTPFRPFPLDKPYLKYLTDELMGPQQITLVDKARQMFVSTDCMLIFYWVVLFKSGRKLLLSKQTQELAETLLWDKVRSVHQRTPEWFQAAMPLSMTPASVAYAEHTGSEIVCVAQNAASRWFKGNTASIVLIDEAAVQEYFDDMLEAGQPMARRLWAITTPYHGNPGAAKFFELKSEPAVPGSEIQYVPGMVAKTTARGHRVIELDAWADPARDEEWLAKARERSTSLAEFQRNVMRNWSISGGATFYPEFAEVGREAYLYEPPTLLKGPVVRGWDFGWRAPVCVWLQYSVKSDRVYVLREFAPRGISAHHFRDVVRYLSGQLDRDGLEPAAHEWVVMLEELPGMPQPPWFPPGTEFVDLSGPEVNAVQSISARDPEEATLRQVWAAGGVEFSVQAGPVKARTTVLRRLLHIRPDGRPGLLISPSCVDVLAMLDGGLTFRKATTLNPMPDEPRKDGRYDNSHDALTYALVGMVPAEGVPGVTPGMDPWPDTEQMIGWTT